MSIKYIGFRDPVYLDGKWPNAMSWEHKKQGESVPVFERGPMLIFELRDGDDLEVPMSNVISIRRDREDRGRHGKREESKGGKQ